VNLTGDFQLNVPAILEATTPRTKLIFICSPNNPTANLMDRESILKIVRDFQGVVVVDEAYIHFADHDSFVEELDELPNVVVLQTFSKAWGMAGLRVGLAIADEQIIGLMNRVKPPYNVSSIAQSAVLEALEKTELVRERIEQTLLERRRMVKELSMVKEVTEVYPTDANFVLAKFVDAKAIYRHLIDCGIVVRDRSNVELCGGCLRITVGTPYENDRLLEALRDLKTGVI
jgi:histidinol-phosphate aminotransferase